MTFLLLTVLITLSIPLMLRFIIDGYINQIEDVRKYFVICLSLVIAGGLGTATRFYLVTLLGERVVADIRQKLFGKIISFSPSFFEKNMTGDLLSRLNADTTLIQTVACSTISLAIRNTFLFFGGLVLMMSTSIKLATLVLLIMPLIVFPVIYLGRFLRHLTRQTQDKLANSSGMAAELIHAASTVQANRYENFAREHYGNLVEESYTTARSRVRARAIITFLVPDVISFICCIL